MLKGCHGAWRWCGKSVVLLLELLGTGRPVAGGAVPLGPGHTLPGVLGGEAGQLPPAGGLRGDGAGARLRLLPHLCPAQGRPLRSLLAPVRHGPPLLPAARRGEAAALADERPGGVHR